MEITNGVKVFVGVAWVPDPSGSSYNRQVYTFFELLNDLGGMEGSIGLIFAPLVGNFVANSFNFNLASKHMKIKRRN